MSGLVEATVKRSLSARRSAANSSTPLLIVLDFASKDLVTSVNEYFKRLNSILNGWVVVANAIYKVV